MIAPTGTIGLVMDCDTTGIEPDFALVKFKKLAGGGYFKIINQSIPTALRRLGYGPRRSTRSSPTPSATAASPAAPTINHESLRLRGFDEETIARVEEALPSAFDIRFAFAHHVLGEEFLQEPRLLRQRARPTGTSTSSPASASPTDEIEQANLWAAAP